MEPIKIRPYFGNGNLKENFVIFLFVLTTQKNVFNPFSCGKFGVIIFTMFRQPDIIGSDKNTKFFLGISNWPTLTC